MSIRSTADQLAALRLAYAEMQTGWYDMVLERWVESPIEALVLAHLMGGHGDLWAVPTSGSQLREAHDWLASVGVTPNHRVMAVDRFPGIYFCLQQWIVLDGRRMRLDLVVLAGNDRYAVEIDGHDFHERTKEQASRDKSRDRLLTLAGWKVLRFTGSEVWRDVASVVSQIEEAIGASVTAANEAWLASSAKSEER